MLYTVCAMARTPKYGIATNPLSMRPRPASERAILALVEKTGITRAEVADEALALGLPKLLRKYNIELPKAEGKAQPA
jgi:hypothetical protein